MTGGKVLVIGDDTRSFLAIVRSLGRRGITVHAAPANFRSPALRSRYVAAIRDLPPWMGDGAEWLTTIAGILRAEHYDLVIPCNEAGLLPLQRHREALSRFARLAIPDDRAIAMLFDKHETREMAKRIGVRVAAGRLAQSDDTAERVLAELGVPVVVKPRHSYSLASLAGRGKVQVVTGAAQLGLLLSQAIPGETVLEQYFAGVGIGISVLANRGCVLQGFEHHRVREVAGVSFYRYSASLTPDLAGACEAIVAGLEYTGLAMFEFKRSVSGDWVLLEVNARPWGSMPLPLALGVDFPHRWYRLLTAGDETRPVPYSIGVYGRNLIPDLENSLIEAEQRQLRPVAKAWFITGRLLELLRVVTGREVHDVLVRDDPRPGLIELLEIARKLLRRAKKRFPATAAHRRYRAEAHVRALREAPVKPRITFVCLGNIYRSPFAEALLRARLCDGAIEIGSAGMMPQPGRPTPVLGIETAAVHGIDLSGHRSAWLTRRMAADASLLIVFDERTRSAVLDRYPDLKAPMILLGDLAELGDIADPVDAGAEEIKRVYGQIAAAIRRLSCLVRRPTRLANTSELA